MDAAQRRHLLHVLAAGIAGAEKPLSLKPELRYLHEDSMRPILWLIPPLIGVAAYLTGGDEAVPLATAETKPSAEAITQNLSEPIGRLEDLQSSLDRAFGEEHDRLLAYGPDELKDLILRLQKAINDCEDPLTDSDPGLRSCLDDAARQLGRLEKGEGLAWVSDHSPSRRMAAMDGWAEVDPEGAFDATVHSQTRNFCPVPALMRMLQRFGERDPALLKERVKEMPWEMVTGQADVGASRIVPPKDSSVEPWIESAAVEMNRLGLDTRDFLTRWMRENPDAALKHWLSGEELPAISHSQALCDMLFLRQSDRGDQPLIRDALDRLSQDDLDRIAGALTDFAKSHDTLDMWRERYPDLIRSESSDGPGKE